jgi:hypothetical protein
MATWHQSKSPLLARAYKPESSYKVVDDGLNKPLSVRGFPFKARAREFARATSGTLISVDPSLKVEVMSLNTGEIVETYMGISPAEAVMAAFAQNERKDFDTNDYYDRYADKVVFGAKSVECGGYATLR